MYRSLPPSNHHLQNGNHPHRKLAYPAHLPANSQQVRINPPPETKTPVQTPPLHQNGNYQETLISSATHYILLRLIGTDVAAFQLLITTRDADPIESFEVMANVEAAITSALH